MGWDKKNDAPGLEGIAINADVILVVDNDSYDSTLSGTKTYKTTTDANGMYEFQIPVTIDGATANIYVADFYSEYVDYDAIEAKATSYDNVLMVDSPRPISLFASGITVTNIKLAYLRRLKSKALNYEKINQFAIVGIHIASLGTGRKRSCSKQ